jgi:dihydropteroate synthase
MSDGSRSPAAPSRPTGPRPGIFAVLNASPDSFSENKVAATDGADLAARMVAEGAEVLDVGAQSLRTDQPEISVDHELARLLPVLSAVRERVPDATLSVDTYRHQVADAALQVGATIVNDPSGLRDLELPDLVAGSGASIVVAFNPGVPKQRRPVGERLADPVEDCLRFVEERLEWLRRAGVHDEQVILDPGPDLYKAPDETIAILRAVPRLRAELGIDRVLWAVSRKDFVGVLTGRLPRDRGAGTLGVLAAVDLQDQDLIRVHDVRATADFLAVRAAMRDGVDGPLEMDDAIRYDPD